ncbi:MAG: transglutaminase-like protein [Gammaproteobacteria bacterium]|nr:transglutaminase-like protein [Gammaproteobacteria bacterium]
MAKTRLPEGSHRGLIWATGAFGAGVLLNFDRVPSWVPVAALVFVVWRLLAASRPLRLPGVVIRSLLALLLVAGVVLRFHTLNGLSAGTALLILMGSVKLLETRAQRDQFIVVAAAGFLLLAACLDRQGLIRAPLYLLHTWLCCAALAVVAYAPTAASSAIPSTTAPVHFDNRAAMLLAGRSLAFALPLAVMLFVFFPRLPGAFWAIPRSDEALTGLGDSMTPGSISQLTASYEVAFRAHFEGSPPPPQERYWRGPVLHEFDGYTWRRTGRSLARMQPLQYLGPEYRYRISLEPSAQRWWFSLDTATGSPEPKVYFTYDYQLISSEPVTEGTNYTLVSHTSTRALHPLPPLARRYDTDLPGDRNPKSRALAVKLRSGVTSDSAYVATVLDLFRAGGFQYTLTPPRLGFDSVDDFLFNTRLGFCGHYASAFTLMMRAAGVPARVVTGYLGGEWNSIGNYFIVRQSDAHSWAEVWLDGRGWTRVDPTAVVAPERLRRGILDILPNAVSAPARFVWSQPWLGALLQRWDAFNTAWNDRVIKFNYGDQLRLLQRLGIKSPGARELGWAFGAGLVGWMLWIAWHVGRAAPRSRPDKLARAYIALCKKLGRAGVTRESHQGPLAFAGEVSKHRPDLPGDVHSLLLRYARLRYGRMERESYPAEVRDFEREVSRLALRARASETPRR